MAEIRYWGPIGIAWERMKDVLFRPFSFEKWLVMGFAAWIAGLNSGGGGSSGTNSRGGNDGFGEGLASGKEAFSEFWAEYGMLVLSIGSILLLIVIAFSVVFAWLHARGKFIFLDNAVYNRAAIVEPWKKYRKQGNSLFLWNLVVGSLSLVAFLLVLAICGAMMWPMIQSETLTSLGICGIVLGGAFFVLFSVFLSYLYCFAYDFVVPLMFKYDTGIRAAWERFSSILKPYFGHFMLYGLVRALLALGVGVAVLLAFVCTCCILLMISAIPYIGTVLLLPVFVLYRFVGIEFLRQFGDEFSIDPQ